MSSQGKVSLKDVLTQASVTGIIALVVIVTYIIGLTLALFVGIISADAYVKAVSPLAMMIIGFYYGSKTAKTGGT